MEEFFMQDGKIWVVIALIASIFVGIILFLIHLDRKLRKLERE